LRRYATTILKVDGSSPDEVIDILSIYLIFAAALWAGVYLSSNRNEYQKIFLRSLTTPY
jgi:hypothetical protein